MAGPLDYYSKGKLIPNVDALAADRNLVFPDSDVDLGQLMGPVSEGFEVAVPPATPALAWTAPSSRYGSDLAYQRSTTSPLVGTASAQRNSSQTHSQNSSLGLNVYLPEPGRLAFLFKVLSEDNFDFLRGYLDGVEKLRMSGATARAGRFVTDVLAPGRHTFDWRFTKDGTTTEAGETAQVDTVETWLESRWLDAQRYLFLLEDFFGNFTARWSAFSAGGGSSVAMVAGAGGIADLATGASTNDEAGIQLGALGQIALANEPALEFRLKLSSTASVRAEFGLWDGTTNNRICWIFDSSVSANWYVRAESGGVSTQVDTGIAADTSYHRYLLTGHTLGIVGTQDGAAVQAGTAQAFSAVANVPTGNLRPYAKIVTLTTAAKTLSLDYVRVAGLR